ncbi:hypothetical protein HanPSC8_Chr11g0462141 [Helianthus annuus]|nr:hypothetical protein HanIR_Chr11g0516571 [Helianthus annuus]KAJ0874270.1 hypothetical protein HanPSC8_Chr11g0462141 [Helianthus annuus]
MFASAIIWVDVHISNYYRTDSDDVKVANLEAHLRRETKFSRKWLTNEKGTDERNGSKENPGENDGC